MRSGQKTSGVIILKLSCVRPQPSSECDLGVRAAHAKVLYRAADRAEPGRPRAIVVGMRRICTGEARGLISTDWASARSL